MERNMAPLGCTEMSSSSPRKRPGSILQRLPAQRQTDPKKSDPDHGRMIPFRWRGPVERKLDLCRGVFPY